jgi:hypothetical protein
MSWLLGTRVVSARARRALLGLGAERRQRAVQVMAAVVEAWLANREAA